MQKLTQLPHDPKFLEKCQEVPSEHIKGYLKHSFKNQKASSLIEITINIWKTETCIFQRVISLWQRDVHRTRIRTSRCIGGATMMSSITNGSPGFLATAATDFAMKQRNKTNHYSSQTSNDNGQEVQKTYRYCNHETWSTPLHLIGCPSVPSIVVAGLWFCSMVLLSLCNVSEKTHSPYLVLGVECYKNIVNVAFIIYTYVRSKRQIIYEAGPRKLFITLIIYV